MSSPSELTFVSRSAMSIQDYKKRESSQPHAAHGVGGRVGWFRRLTTVSGPKAYDNVGMFGVSIGF